MKVASGSAAAAAGPSCTLKAGKAAGGAGEVMRCLSEQSVAISRCASGAGARLPALLDEQQVNVLLYDMNGCYSRLKELVPTLPQNRKVSKVEILQHVIDYIRDLQLELNSESEVGTPGSRGLPVRAPLSTLNGEISALAAEVRPEVEYQIILLPIGKVRQEGGGNLCDVRPILSDTGQCGDAQGRGSACCACTLSPPTCRISCSLSVVFTGSMCSSGRSHLVSLKRRPQGPVDPSPPGGKRNKCSRSPPPQEPRGNWGKQDGLAAFGPLQDAAPG